MGQEVITENLVEAKTPTQEDGLMRAAQTGCLVKIDDDKCCLHEQPETGTETWLEYQR
jgi:hypothetical protein